MKKIFSILILMIAAIIASNATAATAITVNVDSKDRVAFGYNYKMYGMIDMTKEIALANDGENAVEIPDEATSVFVAAKAGFQIASVKANGEPVAEGSWSGMAFEEGMVIAVTSEAKAAAGVINFSCDDYTLVSLFMRSDIEPRHLPRDIFCKLRQADFESAEKRQ